MSSESDTLIYNLYIDVKAAVAQLNVLLNTEDSIVGKTKLLQIIIQQMADKLGISFREAASKVGVLTGSLTGLNQEATKLAVSSFAKIPKVADEATTAISKLGRMFSNVFFSMVAFQVIRFFLSITQKLGEVTKAAKDFYKSLVDVNMGLRAMQRGGIDVSMNEALKAISDITKLFPVISKPEMTEALDNIISKTAQMGVSWENVTTIMKIAAATYVKTGKSMESVSDALINAMVSSSGNMTKTVLEQTELQITAHMLEAKARELGIKNIEKGVAALTEEERATVALAVAWEQLSEKLPDIMASMDTVPAKIDAVSAAWTNVKTEVGLVFLEIEGKLAPYVLDFLNRVREILPLILKDIAFWITLNFALYSSILGIAHGMSHVIVALTSGKNVIHEFLVGWMESFSLIPNLLNDAIENATNIGDEIGKSFGKNIGDGIAGGIEESSPDAIAALADMQETIADMDRDLAIDRENVEIDLMRKLLDIETDYLRKLKELETDKADELTKANEDATEDRVDAEQEYRDNEIEAEEDYQTKLERLREGFLFDLEDALHARDARQVLRLIRQYNLNKKQTTQDYENEKRERARRFAQELADIEEQYKKKLSQIEEEYAKKQAKLEEQAEQDRVDAQLWLDRQMEDLDKAYADRLKKLKEEWANEYGVTTEGADKIYKEIGNYFGKDGLVTQLFSEPTIWETFKTKWDTFWATVKTGWDTFWTTVKTGWDTFWTTTLPTAWATFKTKWDTFWATVKTGWDTFWTTVKTDWDTFWTTTLPTIWTTFKTNWDTFWTTLGTAWTTFWYTTWETIKGYFSGAWQTITNYWSLLGGNFKAYVLDPLALKFYNAWETIKSYFSGAKVNVSSSWSLLPQWFYDNVSHPLEKKFEDAWTTIKGYFSSAWTTITTAWGGKEQGDFWTTYVTNPMAASFKGAINSIIGFFNKLITAVATAINFMIDGLNELRGALDLPLIPHVGGKEGIPQIPLLLAEGAVIQPNTPFTAILGEQKSGRNIEAPEALIRQIIQDEIGGVKTDTENVMEKLKGAMFLPFPLSNGNTSANIAPIFGGTTGGRIKLEVLLSPDLEARIVQQAANNIATTITRIQREK